MGSDRKLNGLVHLYHMVRLEDRDQVVALIAHATKREDTVTISQELDAAFDKVAEEKPEGGGGLLPAADGYIGTIVASEVRESRKSWVDDELSLKIQVTEGEHKGKFTFADIELSPLLGTDGQINNGKLKFVNWQLDALGYDGKLSEVQHRFGEFIGAQVIFEQKVTPSRNINPNTGEPYEDREVSLKKNIMPGHGAPTQTPDAPATGTTTVY